jgi:hypothetical protein
MATATSTQELEKEMLKSKIMELQSALFFTESASIIKLPTHVVSDVEMDAEGRIWFVIPKPAMDIAAYDKEAPAKLDFFKKGKDFFVKVTGIAVLQLDVAEAKNNESLSAGLREKMSDKALMGVMVQVLDMSLVDNTPKPAKSWFQASRSQLSSWFF